jgi:hypothetical protein
MATGSGTWAPVTRGISTGGMRVTKREHDGRGMMGGDIVLDFGTFCRTPGDDAGPDSHTAARVVSR